MAYCSVYNYFGEEGYSKSCNELAIDKSYAKRVSIVKQHCMFDNFWSECV